MIHAKGYAAHSPTDELAPFSFDRHDPREHDVVIDIQYCGICHSDIHSVRDEWGGAHYPMVPGHEILGTVRSVGRGVKKFKPGDTVGVGCLVDSCRTCDACKEGLEQFCKNGSVGTYNGVDRHTGERTKGGYSNIIVVDEAFVLKVTHTQNLAAVAPLLCAGITTYSPLKHWGVGKGQKVGVVGLGGLGHMALKLARSFGAQVTQFTTSKNKVEDAKKLGAHEVILSNDTEAMKAHFGTFDFIIDTVSASHDLNVYLAMLKHDGKLVVVGAPPEPARVQAFQLIMGRKTLAGSLIGGLPETQEMLDYCAKHNIVADVEVIPIDKVNEAYERTLKSDVKYRFVIDMNTL
jgi:alcohol dehydrogenase (NADP+)